MNRSDVPIGDAPIGNDGEELPISRAVPYRTPTDVSDTPARRGLFRSPIAWMVAIGAVMFVGGLLAFTAVRQETRDFGNTRGPIDPAMLQEMERVEYERSMSVEE